MADEPLTEMIRQCQQGKAQAFAWLANHYGMRLYRYFLRASGSAEAAEDLLQDLFVRLLEKIKNYRHEGQFEPWLFRVAANLVRDRARKRKRQSKAFRPEKINRDPVISIDDLPGSQPSPRDMTELIEQKDRLQQALARLSDTDRELILLRFYGGLSFKEIAQHFRAPIGTVLARVHRTMKRLRRIMTENGT